MLKLVYCKGGKAYSDFGLLDAAENIIAAYNGHKKHHSGDFTVTFCTDNLVSAIRVALLRRSIDPSDVQFVYEGEVMTLNSKYQLSHWAKGFGCHDQEFLRELTKYAGARRDKNAETGL